MTLQAVMRCAALLLHVQLGGRYSAAFSLGGRWWDSPGLLPLTAQGFSFAPMFTRIVFCPISNYRVVWSSGR